MELGKGGWLRHGTLSRADVPRAAPLLFSSSTSQGRDMMVCALGGDDCGGDCGASCSSDQMAMQAGAPSAGMVARCRLMVSVRYLQQIWMLLFKMRYLKRSRMHGGAAACSKPTMCGEVIGHGICAPNPPKFTRILTLTPGQGSHLPTGLWGTIGPMRVDAA